MGSSMIVSLPNELLTAIFSYVNDFQTLENLCEVSETHPHLYEIVLAQRWKTVTIDDRDLVPAPGVDEGSSQTIQHKLAKRSIGQSWQPVGEGVRELVKPLNRINRYPANYVLDLILDFRMRRYWSKEVFRRILHPWDDMPSEISLQHSLDILKPHLSNLRSVVCYGDLPQSILNFVADLNKKIQKLELQRLGGAGVFRGDEKSMLDGYPMPRCPLRLETLVVLNHLEHFDIHRLRGNEVR